MTKEKNIYQKYNRQILLKNFGIERQNKLFNSKVLIVGMGGLGCPALQFLCASGINNFGLVDFDIVDISNLHRQILFDTSNIGKKKVEVASEKMKLVNPDAKIELFPYPISKENAFEIIQKYDYILDCTDNFSSRYLISDVCSLLKKKLIMGALSDFEGQIMVFDFSENDCLSYRDIFPIPPKSGEVKSCNEAGILGTVSGTIGTLMANETIKCITQMEKTLHNQILNFDFVNNETSIFKIKKQNVIQKPSNKTEILNTDYNFECETENEMQNNEIDYEQLLNLLKSEENIKIIDVREEYELPKLENVPFENINMIELVKKPIHTENQTIIFACQTGSRSMQVVNYHKDKFPNGKYLSLKNGINNINKIENGH